MILELPFESEGNSFQSASRMCTVVITLWRDLLDKDQKAGTLRGSCAKSSALQMPAHMKALAKLSEGAFSQVSRSSARLDADMWQLGETHHYMANYLDSLYIISRPGDLPCYCFYCRPPHFTPRTVKQIILCSFQNSLLGRW